MKISEVPQDNDPTYEGMKKLCYAQNDKGEFVAVTTTGWKVEETVKDYAWEMIHRELDATRARVRLGRASSLEYFMKLRQMEPRLLAQNMGMWTWRTRWHLRPKVFARLSDHWVQKYAKCLEVDPQLLKTYRGEHALTLD